MNTLVVAANQEAILITEDGKRFYVVYDNEGNAHTYSSYGHLGNQGMHILDESRNGPEESCEFLGGLGCSNSNRTTGYMSDEKEIFDFLRSRANNVNNYVAQKG